ncbi:MAG: uncharacterized protein QOG54_2830 [Actinomycetota bacterium]|jgi:uncharacterized protein YyaL (SSP411 family)|nr:uncharacterized protein [Actinomycetota bacterium]
MSNRLAGETSPYLLQHKDNPVNWYPWGDEALGLARDSDRPILLSIGYAACHWCHVMERESFEDPETARVMNEGFVSIKVDREERPDLDAIYMEAVQAMTGQGGWPMTVFLTPEGRPFYGGTYFPPDDRHGLPSFKRLLGAIDDAWRNRRDEVERQSTELIAHLNPLAQLSAVDEIDSKTLLDGALASFRAALDPEWGGFGGAPKFPQPMNLEFLLRPAARGHDEALKIVNLTLDAMASGGMFDQLAGGFARYSVDKYWLVPHFEKMLYDNAQLLRLYARAWLVTRRDRHREVAEMTATWMLSEMRDPAGGFWSSLDADSEGEEGKFYVWDLDEVRGVTGPDADEAAHHWGFTADGNFEGRNIPVYAREPRDPDAIARARTKLLDARTRRVRSGTDDKVLTAWNGLAASSLAEAGAILDRPEWIAAAVEAMDFVLTTMRPEGRLMRAFRHGTIKHLAFSEDYAAVLEATLALFDATQDARWLDEAEWAAGEAVRLFHDDEGGGFFTTGTDAEKLITRSKDLIDNAVPSANSMLALSLQRLGALTGDSAYEDLALEILRLMHSPMERSPLGFGHLLSAVDAYSHGPTEIVIVGPDEDPMVKDMRRAVKDRLLPNAVTIVLDDTEPGPLARLPLIEGKTRRDGVAAYVCHRGVCDAPVATIADLVEQLKP